MLLKFFPFTLLSVLFLAACSGVEQENRFFRVADGYFIPAEGWSENSPYYYIGANFWYGAILGSETEAGDRQRLAAELDSLKALGISNLRVLVGGDGPDGIPSQIEPSLQTEPGVYDEDVFKGLDWLLAEMGKRRMSAVLYLNNAWEWSGGYARYLEWAGAGDAVLPSVAGWQAYMQYASQFVTNGKARREEDESNEAYAVSQTQYLQTKYKALRKYRGTRSAYGKLCVKQLDEMGLTDAAIQAKLTELDNQLKAQKNALKEAEKRRDEARRRRDD